MEHGMSLEKAERPYERLVLRDLLGKKMLESTSGELVGASV